MNLRRRSANTRTARGVAAAALLIAASLSALFAGMWAVQGQSAPFPAYFTDNLAATVVITTVTPLEQALLDRLDAAKTSIDVAIYDFNRESVRDALLAAHEDGVAIRVVADNNARAAQGSKQNFDALEEEGIPIVVDGIVPTTTVASADAIAEMLDATPDDVLRSAIMHDKYFIVDKRWVWTGSVNMSDSDMTLNHNNALDIESPALAALYQTDFDQMFLDGKFGTRKTASITHTVNIGGAPIQVYFGPQDDPMEQIIAAVNGAQSSIDFAIFTFTDDALADALIAAHARGVHVRGLWDSLAAGNASSDDERMCAAGVPIKIENTRGLMHNKLLVIDAQGAAPTVVTGSLNWTATGNTANNENTLVIANGALTKQYAVEYERMWTTIDVLPCTSVKLPIIFNDAAPPTPTPLPLEPSPLPTITPLPTPAPTPTGTTTSAVRMSRIVYDPPGSDVDGEFVEVVNEGPAAAILTGWTLRDAATNPNIFTFPAFELPPSGAVRVWVKVGVNGAADLFWGRGSAVWNNDGDTATLRAAAGALVAECPYAPAPETGEALCP